MAASKPKSLSIKDKVRILKSVEVLAKFAAKFGIVNSTLSMIIKDKQ